MATLGDRKYLKIPGDRIHELPPLLLKQASGAGELDAVVHYAETIVDADWLLPDDSEPDDPKAAEALESRRSGLAYNLAERYVQFVEHWTWGESILEWIRQCETTFETRPSLRPLLRPDVWPHASRASFVTLLEDKAVPHGDVNLENAMGLRLTFRQPPPIQFLSDKFLLLLNASLASNAFRTWAASGVEAAALPPERFRFFVTGTEIREV